MTFSPRKRWLRWLKCPFRGQGCDIALQSDGDKPLLPPLPSPSLFPKITVSCRKNILSTGSKYGGECHHHFQSGGEWTPPSPYYVRGGHLSRATGNINNQKQIGDVSFQFKPKSNHIERVAKLCSPSVQVMQYKQTVVVGQCWFRWSEKDLLNSV